MQMLVPMTARKLCTKLAYTTTNIKMFKPL